MYIVTQLWNLCLFSITEYLKLLEIYRKVSNFSNARKLCCNLPKIHENRPNLKVFHQKDANGIANSDDPD